MKTDAIRLKDPPWSGLFRNIDLLHISVPVEWDVMTAEELMVRLLIFWSEYAHVLAQVTPCFSSACNCNALKHKRCSPKVEVLSGDIAGRSSSYGLADCRIYNLVHVFFPGEMRGQTKQTKGRQPVGLRRGDGRQSRPPGDTGCLRPPIRHSSQQTDAVRACFVIVCFVEQ
jgi:hypothetical protein